MPGGSKKNRSGFIVVLVVIALFMLLSMFMFNGSAKIERDNYSEILKLFDENKVEKFFYNLNNDELKITLREGETFDSKAKMPSTNSFSDLFLPMGEETKEENQVILYKAPYVGLFLDEVEPMVREYNKENPDTAIEYDYEPIKPQSVLMQILPTLATVVIMLALWFFMMRQSGMGGSQLDKFTQNKAKKQEEKQTTTFDDVAGADEEKAELEEIVEFLKNPKKYNELGARIPKGVLLVGPPGTGKTLLARAVAGEAGVPFFSISGSDFVEMFVGVGAKRVRDLFDQAKKEKPSIIFIDEIDAVGRQRGAGMGGGHDEREQTLNQLLVEMDGFGKNEGVIVLAATNRSDVLDPALLRAGRFDRQVGVNRPDVKGREAILKIHTRNKPLAPDVILSHIAKTTVGFTGADLENLANEAALLTARKNKKAITMEEIEEASIKVVMGTEKKSWIMDEKTKKLLSYHEAGHAVASFYLTTSHPVHQVSIIPRSGGAGGYTMYRPEDDQMMVFKNSMYEDIVSTLGGRVAEEIIMDDISTGASSDIRSATRTARAMVTRYGFSDELGMLEYGTDDSNVFMGRDFNQGKGYSEEVAAKIDKEIKNIVDKAHGECRDILNTNILKLHQVAEVLYVREKIDGDEFLEIMAKETPADVGQGKVFKYDLDKNASKESETPNFEEENN